MVTRNIELDQGNMDAVHGIDSITDAYLELVYADIEANNLEQAEEYLQKADYLRPGQPKIMAAREALDNAIDSRDSSGNVFGQIKNIFK